MTSGSFKNVIYEMCLEIIYLIIYMYKKDLALNNLQWLICHKIRPNQNYIQYFHKSSVHYTQNLSAVMLLKYASYLIPQKLQQM